MEKTRTLYRLRKFKNSITISSLTLIFGISLFTCINLFHNQINSIIRDKSTNVLQEQYQNNINNALKTTNKSIDILEKSSLLAILFSLESMLMVFMYVRMSSKTSKFSKLAPFILGLGTLSIFLYYLIIGLLLPSKGQLFTLQTQYNLLNYFGSILIFLANLIFVYQVFIQIIIERTEK